MLLVEYPTCTTCKRAKKYLLDQGVDFVARDIKLDNPNITELTKWYRHSGLPLKKFFNTSGQVYRNENIKDKLTTITEDEQIALLASNGMLVKRPILVVDDVVLVGFKEDVWHETLVQHGYIK